MTNLLPQQRFFAIIIFISFCLHTALFASGTTKQIAQSRVYKGERILNQLANEFAFPVVYKDRVSLSVIANSYAKEYGINRIVVRDANNKILLQSGVDPMLGGQEFRTDITVAKKTIGHIKISLKSVSHGEIVKFLWLFILTSLIIHVGVWFLYLSCSSPSEEDLQTIRKQAYDDFVREHQPVEHNENELTKSNEDSVQPIAKRPRKQAPKKVLMELADYILEYKKNPNTEPPKAKVETETVDKIALNSPLEDTSIEQSATEVVEKAVNFKAETIQPKEAEIVTATEKVTTDIETNKATAQEKESEDVNTDNKIIGANKSRTSMKKFSSKGHSILFPKKATQPKPKPSAVTNIDVDKQTKQIVQIKQSTLIRQHHKHNRPSLLSGEPSFTKLALKFKYVDKYHLLDKVMPELAKDYFDICSQLLQMAITQLLADKRLQGVSLVNEPSFTTEGAKIELATTNNDQKQLLLASTMLAVLSQMINKVVYDVRREAKIFAFNMNIGISYIDENLLLTEFTEFNKNENVIVSLQYNALKLIKDKVTINKNVEQKYHYVDNMSEDLLLTLVRIRNNVLEME